MQLARWRGRIVNPKLLALLRAIVRKLLATFKTHILQVGKSRVYDLTETYAKSGVFGWAPEVKAWLEDPKVTLYLGVMALFGQS